MFLSIIVPVYNEEEYIAKVLTQLDELVLPPFVSGREVIIVDDHSDDGTAGKTGEFVARHSGFTCISHPRNKGKGACVRTGMEMAGGDVFLIQDADLELSPADIPRMLTAMHSLKVQLVNGSRFLPGIDRPLYSYRRYLANRFFTFLTSVLLNVKLTDMACGYKLVNKELMSRIRLKEDRFGFEAELIIKALRVKKNNIAEVPVHYYPRNEGQGKKFRSGDALSILWTIIKYGLFRLG
jgi:glycosyltransferase involved in cell wall biosynthesis